MALLYRAIWEENRDDLINVGVTAALRWLRAKGLPVEALPQEEMNGDYVDRRFGTTSKFTLSAQHAEEGAVKALQVRLAERRVDDGQQWTTTFTVLCETGPGGTLWVDVERVSEDPFSRVAFRAPALVKILIEEGEQPRLGHVRLEAGPKAIYVGGLAGLIRNNDRRLPIVVFAHDRAGVDVTFARANAAYSRLAGVAQVYVLPPGDVDAFKEKVGEDLAVWGGGARLYLPNRGPGGLRPERHRYVPGARASRTPAAAADIFAEMLAATVPATPAPAAFELVRRPLSGVGPGGELADILELAYEDLRKKDEELQRSREALASLEDELLDTTVDNEELVAEMNRLSANLARMSMPSSGDVPDTDASASELPDTVDTITEAIQLAERLPHIALHPEAPVDIEKLESSVTATAWANTIWRGLRSLDAYAAGNHGVAGGFWEWCRAAGSPWAWPASNKKLAMRESEGVLNNRALRAARMLPVASKVHSSGRIEMLAHLKIAEGGGPLAPRVYFYDDTAGPTTKVHIGFIGPHHHMPNLSTN